jgi:hypothetical protein
MFVVIAAGDAMFIKCATDQIPWGMLVGQLAFFAAIPILALAPRLLPMLGYESLRPLRRATYLRERALAIAVQTGRLWLGLAGVVVAATALLSPAALRLPGFWLALAGSALFQLPVLAASFWVLRFRSPLLMYVMMIVPFALLMPASMAFSLVAQPHRPLALTVPIMLGIAAGVVLLSGLILADAYRRWLRTDLA